MKIKNVHGNTLDLLGQRIVSAQYPCGSSLQPEQALCNELGVSRTVIREVVKSLVAKGLLSTGPKVGTRVLPEEHWNWFDPDVVAWQSKVGLTNEFLRDLQELRRVVEPAGVRLAAQRATSEDIALIEMNLVGETYVSDKTARLTFRRGVGSLPTIGDACIFRGIFDANGIILAHFIFDECKTSFPYSYSNRVFYGHQVGQSIRTKILLRAPRKAKNHCKIVLLYAFE